MASTMALPGVRHFFLGGSTKVLQDLEAEVERRFPQAVVAGRMSPPFRDPSPEELTDWAAIIVQSRAHIVWVGLGTPRQDGVVAALVGKTGAVLVAVGAAFDFLSGNKREAPRALRRTGLEWIFRLATEPRRLWRRYLFGNAQFVGQALRELRDRDRE
jgi:N-acetylglucosaminyldiphosphoundecaprenol N-acetyl-beta-D-mannosaminyltransferase